MNRSAFEALIAENLAWLDSLPHSLERSHVREIVRNCVKHYYPESASASPSDDGASHPQEKIAACCPHGMWMHDAAGRCEKEGCECSSAVAPRTAEPQDLLDEYIPRVLELLREAGITEPDTLKHALEDHDRWRKALMSGELIERTLSASPRTAPATSAETEKRIREYLWLTHGHQGQYGDDGEMQCSACAPVWDYRRMPLGELVEQAFKVREERVIAALIKAQASASPSDDGA